MKNNCKNCKYYYWEYVSHILELCTKKNSYINDSNNESCEKFEQNKSYTSNCCNAQIMESGICIECKEHCNIYNEEDDENEPNSN